MKPVRLFIFFVTTLSFLGFAQKTQKSNYNKAFSISDLEIPKIKSNDVVIKHKGFTLLYDEKYEQAKWVAYELTQQETQTLYQRTDNFVVDPMVKSGTSNNRDYKGSGFDRGHLAPAGDMGWSETTMAESFYYSNISPQLPSFNRGIWKNLEEVVRNWAIKYGSIYIVTGPILKNGLRTIGPNRVSVPNFYFKVILDYYSPEKKGIGFILPNKESSVSLKDYAVTIDSVESFSGIDFFPQLPDAIEAKVEGSYKIASWSWIVSTKSSFKSGKSLVSVQCKGKTKTGKRCKNKTTSHNGLCYWHGGN